MECSYVIVLLLVKNLVTVGYPRSNNLCHTAPDKFFGQFRILKLVTYCHLIAGTYKFGEIQIDGVVRETCKLYVRISITLLCQDNTKDTACNDSIPSVSLIKVPDSHDQEGFRVESLKFIILLNQW